MTNGQQEDRNLNVMMEHVINDTEHFLEDIKGQRHLKRLFKKDVQHLKEHLKKLGEHVAYLELEHTE